MSDAVELNMFLNLILSFLASGLYLIALLMFGNDGFFTALFWFLHVACSVAIVFLFGRTYVFGSVLRIVFSGMLMLSLPAAVLTHTVASLFWALAFTFVTVVLTVVHTVVYTDAIERMKNDLRLRR